MADYLRGADYYLKLHEGETTASGQRLQDEHNSGLSPREYLEARGWRSRATEKSDCDDLVDGWLEIDFSHPIYGGWEYLARALLTQHEQEVKSVGGYENYMRLIDDNGTPAWEFQY